MPVFLTRMTVTGHGLKDLGYLTHLTRCAPRCFPWGEIVNRAAMASRRLNVCVRVLVCVRRRDALT